MAVIPPTAFRQAKAAFGIKGNAEWRFTIHRVGVTAYGTDVQVVSLPSQKLLYRKEVCKYTEAMNPDQTLDNDPKIIKLRTLYNFPIFSDAIREQLGKRRVLIWFLGDPIGNPPTRLFGLMLRGAPILFPVRGWAGPANRELEFISIDSPNDYARKRPVLDSLRLSFQIRELTPEDFAEMYPDRQNSPIAPDRRISDAKIQDAGRKRRRTHKKVKKNKKKTSRR